MGRGGLAAAVLAVILSLGPTAVAEVNMALVTVGSAGNTDDSRTGFGSVDYEYSIGQHEVTVGQYTEFLNAVARSDPYNLYFGTDLFGIVREGNDGAYSYNLESGYPTNHPVRNVTWSDAVRFCNWLTNGQPTTGFCDATTTEDGSYALFGAHTNATLMAVVREPGARYVLPTEDEWYKAAYFNPQDDTYYLYPMSSNARPSNDLVNSDPGNHANYWEGGSNYSVGSPFFVTAVGEFENSTSPWGTFDQGGNVWEELEDAWDNDRVMRGGGCESFLEDMSIYGRTHGSPLGTGNAVGFRVVLVPEPATALLIAFGIAGMLGHQRRHAKTT